MSIPIDFAGAVSPISRQGPSYGKIKHAGDLWNQQMYWRGLDGWYVVSQMTRSHRINCVKMVLGETDGQPNATHIRASCMYGEIQWEMAFVKWVTGPLGIKDENIPDDVFPDQERELWEAPIDDDEEWLRQTKLFRRLNLGLGL